MKNYYEILHVANFAEIEIVKAAYRAISKLYHPDVNKDVDTAVMTEINLAYEVIGNPQKKAQYDIELKSYLQTKKESYSHSNCDYDYDKRNTDNKCDKKAEPTSKAGKVFRTIGKAAWEFADAFLEGARELQQESENAYYQGTDLDDFTLVKKYLKSTGAKRKGYLKVLIERRLIYIENEELVPSYEFKNIARYIKGERKNGY